MYAPVASVNQSWLCLSLRINPSASVEQEHLQVVEARLHRVRDGPERRHWGFLRFSHIQDCHELLCFLLLASDYFLVVVVVVV